MEARALVRLLRQNMRRNLRHLMLSSFGIVLGIAAFVFFLGLSAGVSNVVLHEIFPIDRVEVIPPKTSVLGVGIELDDAVAEQIRARPEVKRAFPKMRLAFPAKGNGSLKIGEGPATPVKFEVAGFCDGIDPALVADEAHGDRFRDWDLEEDPKGLPDCGPEPTNACEKDRFCDVVDRKCHRRVPVLVSRTLIEIYNGSFAPSHNLPKIGAAQEAVVANRLKSMKFDILLGESYVAGSTDKILAKPRKVEAQVVGISKKAMPIGMTIPIGYIKRWNREYAGEGSVKTYSSIVVDLVDEEEMSSFVAWARRNGWEQEDSAAEQIAAIIYVVTTLFIVIALTICFLSAVNIANTFFMLLSERRREIGLMRAVGASRADIWKIVLGEAAGIGLVAGTVGIGIAIGVAKLLDLLSAQRLADYPFKPDTYFQFTPWLIVAALGFALAFSVLGAFLPARKASRIHPAQALTG